MLFIHEIERFLYTPPPFYSISDADNEIDVISVTPAQSVPYDMQKAQSVMNECERYINFARTDPDDVRSDEDWEDKLSRWGYLSRMLLFQLL